MPLCEKNEMKSEKNLQSKAMKTMKTRPALITTALPARTQIMNSNANAALLRPARGMAAPVFGALMACLLGVLAPAADGQTYSVTDLGALTGPTGTSQANGINNNGQIVGSSTTSGAYHAFSYSGGTMTDLGTLTGTAYSPAHGINNQGQIVGVSRIHSCPYRGRG